MDDHKDYYGLAPNKAVGIKYCGANVVCEEVVKGKDGKIVELHCRLDNSEGRPKPKTYISWVPADSVKAEVRLYNHLFVVPEPSSLWEDELNPNSEIVYPAALIDPSIKEFVDGRNVDKWKSNAACQFERLGYFVVDSETTFDPETGEGKLVLNRTVSLKEETFKAPKTAEELAAIAKRTENAQNALAAKEARMNIDPVNLFREAEEYRGKYSKYNDKGIPTHMEDGTEVSKSMMKKLDKEKTKHEKQLAKWQKSQSK